MTLGGIFTPATFGIPYMAPWLKTPDGIDLSCFLIPQTRSSLDSSYKMPTDSIVDERVELTEAAADARATVIVFHGNSMHNCQDYKEARRLYKMKCNVFLLSYRGYVQLALKSHVFHNPVEQIVLGHSLGGGVAIDLASRNPSRIAAVIVSNTFTSIPDIVRTWPVIGHFSFICSQKWRSKDKLHLIPTTTPILMISGRQDEVIPAKLMDELWRAAQERGIRRKSSIRWPTICRAEDDTGPASDALPEHDEFVAVEGETHSKLHIN
ncbi:hypothetical protein C0993_009771 [Termitomyces sp. T159_Od127]|nr:hypothetical protein C0993_009771 [Termitomyces sp. T159_Od127]